MIDTLTWTNNFLNNWPTKTENMNDWICEECGTCYSSKADEIKESVLPKWSDGHKCSLVILKGKEHKELIQAQAEYRELIDTMLPDDCNTHIAGLQRKIEKLKRLVQTEKI